jgi:hypothetical protein
MFKPCPWSQTQAKKTIVAQISRPWIKKKNYLAQVLKKKKKLSQKKWVGTG